MNPDPNLSPDPFDPEPAWYRHLLSRLPGSCLVSFIMLAIVIPALLWIGSIIVGWLMN